MPKQKSSASSATRKKHAKKAAGPSSEVQELPKEKKLKGKAKAKSKAEPKKKSYIPPVRPRAVQPDPLETLGIAYTIPSDLLVILRRLGKKDAVTKTRALEDFQSTWVTKAIEDTDDNGISQNLTEILPVWVCPITVASAQLSQRINPPVNSSTMSRSFFSILLAGFELWLQEYTHHCFKSLLFANKCSSSYGLLRLKTKPSLSWEAGAC